MGMGWVWGCHRRKSTCTKNVGTVSPGGLGSPSSLQAGGDEVQPAPRIKWLTRLSFLMEVNGLLIPLQALQLGRHWCMFCSPRLGLSGAGARPGPSPTLWWWGRLGCPGRPGCRLGAGSQPRWRHTEPFMAGCFNAG